MKFAMKDGQRIAVAVPARPDTLSLALRAFNEQDPELRARAAGGLMIFKGWLGIDQRSILDGDGNVESSVRIEAGDVLLPENGIVRAPTAQA